LMVLPIELKIHGVTHHRSLPPISDLITSALLQDGRMYLVYVHCKSFQRCNLSFITHQSQEMSQTSLLNTFGRRTSMSQCWLG
jgi:hypothetical protein